MAVWIALAAVALCVACAGPAPVVKAPTGIPPAPVQGIGSVAPGEPPRVWIAGTLTDVTDSRIQVREASGQDLSLQRLAAGTTAFYRIAGDGWAKLAPQAQVAAGQAACTEALLDGRNLLALRVFLGTECGPA